MELKLNGGYNVFFLSSSPAFTWSYITYHFCCYTVSDNKSDSLINKFTKRRLSQIVNTDFVGFKVCCRGQIHKYSVERFLK